MPVKIIISIIIPIYNSEKFIETAIQSIKCQLKSWIEVVLVNDGSNDGSDFICKKHISNQIKYHCTDNCGAGHARNIGIDCAKGEWIIFLDSDDLILKNFFNEELLSFLNTCKNNKTCTSQQKLDTNFKYYLSINLISVQYGASFATFLSG